MRVTKHENFQASPELHGTLAAIRALLIFAIFYDGTKTFVAIKERIDLMEEQFHVTGKDAPEFLRGFRIELTKFLSCVNGNEDLLRNLVDLKGGS